MLKFEPGNSSPQAPFQWGSCPCEMDVPGGPQGPLGADLPTSLAASLATPLPQPSVLLIHALLSLASRTLHTLFPRPGTLLSLLFAWLPLVILVSG